MFEQAACIYIYPEWYMNNAKLFFSFLVCLSKNDNELVKVISYAQSSDVDIEHSVLHSLLRTHMLDSFF
jgi:hypothetical protein